MSRHAGGVPIVVAVAAVAACLLAGWIALALVARRWKDVGWRELLGVVPAAAVTARRLARHPAVPRRAKVVVALAAVWVLSPVDLVPEFLPVVGAVDDVVVVVLALRWAARQVPRAVVEEAWPGDPRLLDRLLG